jgi:hypothetical protein
LNLIKQTVLAAYSKASPALPSKINTNFIIFANFPVDWIFGWNWRQIWAKPALLIIVSELFCFAAYNYLENYRKHLSNNCQYVNLFKIVDANNPLAIKYNLQQNTLGNTLRLC